MKRRQTLFVKNGETKHRFSLRSLLLLILSRREEVNRHVDKTKTSQKPEEVIEMTRIQIIRDPTFTTIPRREVSHKREDQRTQVVPKSIGQKSQSTAQAPHRIWRLIIEKLKLANEVKHFRRTEDEVLRNLPHHGYRNRSSRLNQPELVG